MAPLDRMVLTPFTHPAREFLLHETDVSSVLLRSGDARFEERIYVAISNCASQGLDGTGYELR